MPDYRIPDDRIVSGSPEKRAELNLCALRVLSACTTDDRPPTDEERDTLASYVGWGACPQIFAANTPYWEDRQKELRELLDSQDEYEDARRSTVNAHYTADFVVDSIWRALERLGAQPGMTYLEPAVGVGNFLGRMPDRLLAGSKRVAIEKDAVTGRIARLLYPETTIQIQGFEDAELPANYFDCVVSNVPFGDFGVHDPAYSKFPFLTSSIHNYFFVKALDLVRPGGVIAFITSRYTMDGYSPAHKGVRSYLAGRADLLGAVRLPSSTFEQSAGTKVVTDALFLRKRLPGADPATEAWTETQYRSITTGWNTDWIYTNEYFVNHPCLHSRHRETSARPLFATRLHHRRFDHSGPAQQHAGPRVARRLLSGIL